METPNRFEISLTSLSANETTHDWHLDDSFFEAIEDAMIQHGTLDVNLGVRRKEDVFELTFSIQGEVQVPCNRCLELMHQPIQTEETLRVRLGDEYDDDGETITVPADPGTIDVTWNLYELIALQVPIHHVHPEGQCNADMTALLNSHTPGATADPRWEALRALSSHRQS